jgi:hypothetical protein
MPLAYIILLITSNFIIMKNNKTGADNNKSKSLSNGKNKKATNSTNSGTASAKVRPNSGHGLNNEGTTTSYEDQQRN